MALLPSFAGLPEQPALRPGISVTRHDDHHLQVGVDPPQRVVVPDVPAVRRLLDALAGATALPGPDEQTWPVLRRLWEAGLLVDARSVAASITHGPAAAVRAAWAQFGLGAGDRLGARAAARVRVAAEDDARADVSRLLRASGVQVVEEGAADVWLIVHDGEVPRASVDDLVREGVAHLLVSGALGSVVIGPFVLPGVTACLRCVDAHRAETDPRRALVVEQVVSRPPAAVRDPALHALALAWATRDLLRFVEGDQPSTWSASFDLGPVAAPERRAWTRHPHCGCSWDETLVSQAG
ncbi:hypothetical protein NPS01_24810 [Nocardioides psychrotolerans]|uniref:Bacteriocin biosynthesis cyclodehydratase domain-containing protein n=1 Tax=Nocardioides psychrotolerans TaxID=1005945 RepID=A0A1I3L4P1_9ACTN|nr:hypothetical protein [Nocardioides psychrotolerans]GEP38818.1 hypothetical protein NPS01_24810 [Nocardioides psychrotolerans]SFI79576.1 hypothetical protein SAMN05216561_11322 [Nocardioides psychrotolerans]